jgi:hypothetical protein
MSAFEPTSGHAGFVVGKVALGQVFSEYFGFPCQFLFRRLLHIHHLSSGAGTIGQLVADVPSGLSLTPPQETNLLTTFVIVKRQSDYLFLPYIICCFTTNYIVISLNLKGENFFRPYPHPFPTRTAACGLAVYFFLPFLLRYHTN